MSCVTVWRQSHLATVLGRRTKRAQVRAPATNQVGTDRRLTRARPSNWSHIHSKVYQSYYIRMIRSMVSLYRPVIQVYKHSNTISYIYLYYFPILSSWNQHFFFSLFFIHIYTFLICLIEFIFFFLYRVHFFYLYKPEHFLIYILCANRERKKYINFILRMYLLYNERNGIELKIFT